MLFIAWSYSSLMGVEICNCLLFIFFFSSSPSLGTLLAELVIVLSLRSRFLMFSISSVEGLFSTPLNYIYIYKHNLLESCGLHFLTLVVSEKNFIFNPIQKQPTPFIFNSCIYFFPSSHAIPVLKIKILTHRLSASKDH